MNVILIPWYRPFLRPYVWYNFFAASIVPEYYFGYCVYKKNDQIFGRFYLDLNSNKLNRVADEGHSSTCHSSSKYVLCISELRSPTGPFHELSRQSQCRKGAGR